MNMREELLGIAMRKDAWAAGHRPRLPDNSTSTLSARARDFAVTSTKDRNKRVLAAMTNDWQLQFQMCRALGVSQSAMRDAVWRLHEQGLIEGRKNGTGHWLWRLADAG